MRTLRGVRTTGRAMVDWRGKVAVGVLLQETLRSILRRPVSTLVAPAGVLFAVGALATTIPVPIQLAFELSFVLVVPAMVALWGWMAQDFAKIRELRALVRLSMVAMLSAGLVVYASRLLATDWLPFIVALALLVLPSLAVPASAVDGLGLVDTLRHSIRAGRGSRARLWYACGLLMAAHIVVGATMLFVLSRFATVGWIVDDWIVGGGLCLVIGSAIGSTMALRSLAYLQLRRRMRLRDASRWVEVFE
jgi:hypothetical protein